MDAGEAAILGSAVTGSAVVLAGLFGVWAEGRRSAASEKRARAQANADRVRAFRKEQIRETETVVSEQLQAVRLAMTSHFGLVLLWRAWRLQRTLNASLQADLLLIGEIDAYVALAEVLLVVGQKFPTGPYRGAWLGLLFTLRKPWTAADLAKLDAARSMCLDALRRQEERALRDEPLVSVSPEQARERINLEALEAAAARVSGKAPKREGA